MTYSQIVTKKIVNKFNSGIFFISNSFLNKELKLAN